MRDLSPRWLVALLCGAAASTVVVLGTRLTFFNDDWYFLLQRPGLESGGGIETVLAPHNGNLVAIPAILYKALQAIFGLHSQLPYRLVLALAIAALGVVVYRFVSERLGPMVGLAAAAVVVFLGPAWEDLLFFASIDLVGSLVTGLAALTLLGQDTPRRNAGACLLLICAVACSNAGIPFVVGGVLAIAFRRRLRQLWIPAVPLLVFALWWAFYGSSQPSHVSAHNIKNLPVYVFQSLSYGLSSATGLNHGSVALDLGYALAAAAIVLALIRMSRLRRAGGPSLVVGVTLLAFWCLTGAGYVPGRDPIAGRYQLIDVTLLIALAAELFRGVDLSPRWRAVLCSVTVAVIASNLVSFFQGFDFLSLQSRYAEAELGALRISGARTPEDLWLTKGVALNPYLSGITAGRYFAVTRANGSPAFLTPAQIAVAAEPLRHAVDSVLVHAEGLSPQRVRARPMGRGCAALEAGLGRPGPPVVLSGSPALVNNPSSAVAALGLTRFAAPSQPTYVAFLKGHETVRVAGRRDSVPRPWRLEALATHSRRRSRIVVCQ